MAATTIAPAAPTLDVDDQASDDHVVDVGRRTRNRRIQGAVIFAAIVAVASLLTLGFPWYSATVNTVSIDGRTSTMTAEINGWDVWNMPDSTSQWGSAPSIPRNYGILGPTFWAFATIVAVSAGMKFGRSSIAVVGVIVGWKYGSAALSNLYASVAGPDAVGDWQITTYAAPGLYGMAFVVAAGCCALATFGLWLNWRDDRAAERAALIAAGQPLPPNWLERLATTVVAVLGRIVRNALAEDRRDND